MHASALPDASALLAALDLTTPLVGLYDAPDPEPFAPLVRPAQGSTRGQCLFHFYRRWEKGETLHLTADNYGCGGCGRSLFGVQTREREDFIDFLWGDEGLRGTRELMAGWIDHAPTYHPDNPHVLVGPLRDAQARYLKTVTFWANADQLSVLQHDLEQPQAVIGGTDVAMRDGLSAGVLAFTVTVPLFAQLCALGEDSFLGKGFLRRLRKARGGSLH